MKPKPPPAEHRRELVRVLSASLARAHPNLDGWLQLRRENFVLIPWTTLFYDYRRDMELDLPGIAKLLEQPEPLAVDKREIDSLVRRMKRVWHLFGDSYPWLTNIVASKPLKLTLADTHRYLDNREGVADQIRGLLKDALLSAWEANERILLIGHSLGSVIAYDVLWEFSQAKLDLARNGQATGERRKIDTLLTLGSPLATRFIRKALQGASRRGADRYPTNIRRWVNVTARGDMVALHPRIKPFFKPMLDLGLVESIEDDAGFYNHFRGSDGLDTHKSYGYLNQLGGVIGDWISESN